MSGGSSRGAFRSRSYSGPAPRAGPHPVRPTPGSCPCFGVTGRPLFDPLRLDRPLIGPADDLADEAPVAECGDDQPAAGVGGHPFGHGRAAECDQAVEIEVRAPWARLTMWWTSRAPPRPQAWHLQRARRNTIRRITAHSSREAVGRPVARGPPCWIRRRAAAPTRPRVRSDRLSIAAARGFAHVGQAYFCASPVGSEHPS